MNLDEIKEAIAKMTPDERLDVLEMVGIAIAKDEMVSPAWHGEVLAERMAKMESGKAKFLTLDELDGYLRD